MIIIVIIVIGTCQQIISHLLKLDSKILNLEWQLTTMNTYLKRPPPAPPLVPCDTPVWSSPFYQNKKMKNYKSHTHSYKNFSTCQSFIRPAEASTRITAGIYISNPSRTTKISRSPANANLKYQIYLSDSWQQKRPWKFYNWWWWKWNYYFLLKTDPRYNQQLTTPYSPGPKSRLGLCGQLL